MSGTSVIASFVRQLGLITFFLCTAGLSGAQTPVRSPEALKTEPQTLSPSRLNETDVASTSVLASAPTTTLGLDKSEANLMNAAAEPARSQPAAANPAPAPTPCNRKISAEVVALPHPIMLNRLGASVPDGLVFALKGDTLGSGATARLMADKRPRPIVLRANVGDCLTITFSNSIPKTNFGTTKVPGASTGTTEVSLHVQGMEWVKGSDDDGSFVGTNNSSLASVANPSPTPMPPQTLTYNLYAKEEGTFLLYTMGDTSTQGIQLQRGLFGALNVQPQDAEWYRSQVTREDLVLSTKKDSSGKPKMTASGHPIIDYTAVYPAGHPRNGVPILNMLDSSNQLVHSDLTAMITGPKAGRFEGTTGPNKPEPPCNAEGNAALGPVNGKGNPLFCENPAAPDRKQPYREVTIIYHEVLDAVTSQAFPVMRDPTMKSVTDAGKDAFAINYGTGGISAEVYANRIGVGPMGSCVDCKFEEFFLSAWSVGDAAMLVDVPANANLKPPLPSTPAEPPLPVSSPAPPGVPPPPLVPALCTTPQLGDKSGTPPTPTCANPRVPGSGDSYTLKGIVKATKAYYPDDPSNVYHSYINDHIKFRILHGGTGVSHVHHQHAHQWLQSPNSDQGSYLDSQMISPGAGYTLEMTYNGSGNRNKVVGDSIFHCHFYPHFAAGMWAMWRTHDVFESGSELKNGIPILGARALPDGEIQAGTPIPAVVPLPTIPMAPIPGAGLPASSVFIDKGEIVFGTPAAPDPTGANVTENPGFPFFIPGVAGARAPHPPLDFAPDTANGGFMDGGLPRHVVTGGSISYERHTTVDWSKDLATMNAIKLPEDGTRVEKVAMQFHGRRCQPSFFPDGTAGSCPSSNSTPPQSTLNSPPTGFVLNGLPLGPQSGAPFADPAIDDNGNPVNYNPATKVQTKRTYKAAAIQVNLVFNKKPVAWHFPQGRILTLWNDVEPTIDFTFGKPGRQPEPLFFRGNSGDIIEYWHTNLVPSYYIVDDFQVRTPTDILGQHIHLVKFDVTSSDGAGNGFNYEDGTFSPQEVQETIHAINQSPTNGFVNEPGKPLTPKAPPKEIVDCQLHPEDKRCMTCEEWHEKKNIKITAWNRPQCQSWWGAQTTIQRWYLDPLVDNSNVDRTMRTVFTHDHFGPSTHQQAGLYAGLLIEPTGSSWRNSETGQMMGGPTNQPPVRPDGGPTSWKADILVKQGYEDISYREFALEFQDFQLAYMTEQRGGFGPPKFPNATSEPNPDPSKGYINNAYSIGAPVSGPTLISTGAVGSQSVNYLNEPVPYRIGTGDASEAFNSAILPCPTSGPMPQNCQPNAKMSGDPITPLLRAYQGDNVQLRLLVGAHMFAHQFNLEGPTWFAEPAWKNSGYRSVQAMGLSEHFEFLFQAPSSSAPKIERKCPDGMSQGNCVDYLYSPSLDEFGISNGMWGLFRVYDPDAVANKLAPLPNNPIAPNTKVDYATCPNDGSTPRKFYISAVSAQRSLAGRPANQVPGSNPKKGQIVFNDRTKPVLAAPRGLMYVYTDDLDPTTRRLKDGVPVEPLILRAKAGECIEVYLKNEIPYDSDVFKQSLEYAFPLDGLAGVPLGVFPSKLVGLHPQLLSYDGANSSGSNIGFNTKEGQPSQTVKYNDTVKYTWYAGKIDRDKSGKLNYTPVEFGTLNLFPADPLFQASNSLFGSMVIEPADSSWNCDGANGPVSCEPHSSAADKTGFTRASATVTGGANKFREFVVMLSDAERISGGNTSAINYRTEPKTYRYAGNSTKDFSCMLSNQLVKGDPKTPIFSAEIGDKVRFRMAHPYGTGTSQVFTVHGHVWPRNPYKNESKDIGENSLSQWLGSRDNHGATDHFEIVLDKAGGESGKPGDYLYTTYLPAQAKLGAWGLFRVGKPNPDWLANGACVPVKAAPAAPAVKEVDADRDRFIRQPINQDAKP
jgi:manganese oxidase